MASSRWYDLSSLVSQPKVLINGVMLVAQDFSGGRKNYTNNKILSVHVETKGGEVWFSHPLIQHRVRSLGYRIMDKSVFKDGTVSFSQIRCEDIEAYQIT